MRISFIAGGQTAEGPGTLGSSRALTETAVALGHSVDVRPLPSSGDVQERLDAIVGAASADVVFPLVSGLEGVLALLNVPYVGSAPGAAALAAHKGVFNDVVRQLGLKSINYVYGVQSTSLVERARAELRLPVFVKPARLGASYGITRVQRWVDLDEALAAAAQHDSVLLIEESIPEPFVEYEVPFISGPEVIAGAPARVVLPVSSTWHDTASKYSTATALEPVPSRREAEALTEAARTALEQSGLTGPSRVDLFVDEQGSITVGEINAVPGHGPASTFPRIFELAGISREAQLQYMLDAALHTIEERRHEKVIA